MEYPQNYSSQARARVEAERLRARKDLDLQRKKVPWSRYGPTMADEENFQKYILRVFLVFAQEACKLGLQGVWTIDEIRPEVDEFLRRFTIEAYHDDGHDSDGRKLGEMICHWDGSVLPDVRRQYEESPQWHQFEDELLAVAEQQAEHTLRPNGAGPAIIRKVPKDADRRSAVDAYIDEVFKKTGKRITRTHIWKAARYTSRTEFERWERKDPKRSNRAADERFTRILAEKPHMK